MKFKNIFIIVLLIFFTSANFSQQEQSSTVTMQRFKEELKNDKQIIVLDVRTEEELAGPLGKIEKTINIPIHVLEQRLTELKPYKDKEIFVICRTQNRSTVAVSILQKNGYKAKNVLGGMAEFRK